MRFTGKLKTWTDDRGFGFITPTEGGQDIFVHISEYPRGRTPIVNEMLSFEVELNPQGKKKAVRVQLAGVSPARTAPGPMPRATHTSAPGRARPTNGSVAKVFVVLAMLVLTILAGYRHYSQRTQSPLRHCWSSSGEPGQWDCLNPKRQPTPATAARTARR
jgi:cold shock CspA family protein